MTTNKIILTAILSAVIFSGSVYAGYSLIESLTSPKITNINDQMVPSPTTPVKLIDAKSYCPLNGKEYSVDDQIRWEKLGPVAVMIENHPDSRPQSGLTSADIVYEAVAEGGITRFMGIFLCDETPRFVGPVRSARTYFLDWVSEYDALYAHVGGANTPGPADALTQIATYGIKSINEIPLGSKNSLSAGFQRIEDRLGRPVSLEHTMYLELQKLREFAQNRFNWGVTTDGARWDSTFEKWKYPDESSQITQSPTKSEKLIYNFWESTSGFNVEWQYQPSTKTYKRFMNNQPHIDNNNKQQIEVSNVIVMIQDESRANDGYQGNLHLLYETIGRGDAYILNNGNSIKGSWFKSGRTARTKFLSSTGKEVVLERGKTWISIVPSYSQNSINDGNKDEEPATVSQLSNE